MSFTTPTGRRSGGDDRPPTATRRLPDDKPTPLLRGSTDGLTTKFAGNRDERLQAYRLLYQSYREMGYTSEHPSGLLYRAVWGHPLSRTIVVQDKDHAVVGTVTTVDGSESRLPAEDSFFDEIAALRDAGRSIMELTGLAISAGPQRRSLSILFLLTRFAGQLACRRAKTDLVFTVHPRHHLFYQKFFDVDVLGPCRAQPVVRGNPGIACRVDLQNLEQLALPQTYFEKCLPPNSIQHCAMPPADHAYLCRQTGVPPFIGETSKADRQDAA